MRIADRKDKIGRKISREAWALLHRFTIVTLCRILAELLVCHRGWVRSTA